MSGTIPVIRHQYVGGNVRFHTTYSSFLDDVRGTNTLLKHTFRTLQFLQTQIFTQLQTFCRWRYWILSCEFGVKCSQQRGSKGARFLEILLMTAIIYIKMNFRLPTNYHILTLTRNTAIISSPPAKFKKFAYSLK